MIQTSTNVRVELSEGKLPANPGAIAVFAFKNGRLPAENLLDGVPARQTLQALQKAKAISGKANEVTAQLIDGPRPHWLLAVGTGDNGKENSPQNLREAAAVLAK